MNDGLRKYYRRKYIKSTARNVRGKLYTNEAIMESYGQLKILHVERGIKKQNK